MFKEWTYLRFSVQETGIKKFVLFVISFRKMSTGIGYNLKWFHEKVQDVKTSEPVDDQWRHIHYSLGKQNT